MLTGKERSKIKKDLHGEEPKLFIGKNGITENLIKEADVLLEKYEVLKVKTQKSVAEEKNQLMEELMEALGAEYVMDIGSVFAIYREKTEEE